MKQELYINREVSWLKFNARVLQEAKDPSVPLLERLRFLGIYSNNLDEFYSVRYSRVLRSIQLKSRVYKNIIEGQTDEELIEQINQIVAEQRIEYDDLYDKILLELEQNDIYFIDDKNVPDAYTDFVTEYFNSEISQTLGVYILDKNTPAPPLRDGAFYLAVNFIGKDYKKCALIDVPTQSTSRFVLLPKIDEKQYVMYLEDIIRFHLDEIFKVLTYEKLEAHSIKISRDSELEIDNDLEDSIIEKIAKSLENRRKGEPVRIVYDKSLNSEILDFLKKKLQIDDYDSVIPGGKYHNKRDLMNFPNLGKKDLVYKKIKPIVPKSFSKYKTLFKAISAQDHLLYMPYHDYSVFINFLREAAIDPKVTKIGITIYRVPSASKVMIALINAARNGKEVTAVLELRARFDEANNVKWSKRLKDAGVKVIFGVQGLKVHSKVGYIERKPDGETATSYAFISTGNFHSGTAKLYTDHLLLTSNPEITKEINQVFRFFNANYLTQSYKHLLVSPMKNRKKLVKFIKKEIKNHRKGLPSGINLKLNSLSDKEIIDLLYQASQAGVKIRLVVRGIHSLIPGIKGISENIESVGIIDKFLEHTRIYWFKNAGDDRVFISSADMMVRNLDMRVEVGCPIYDENIKQTIMDTFDLSFNDNVKTRYHDAKDGLTYKRNEQPPLRSQLTTYDYFLKKESISKEEQQLNETSK